MKWSQFIKFYFYFRKLLSYSYKCQSNISIDTIWLIWTLKRSIKSKKLVHQQEVTISWSKSSKPIEKWGAPFCTCNKHTKKKWRCASATSIRAHLLFDDWFLLIFNFFVLVFSPNRTPLSPPPSFSPTHQRLIEWPV